MSLVFPPIVCTLGTTTDDDDVLRAMAEAGMGMARLNTAYASLDEIAERIDRLRRAAPVPVMLDLKGRQLRVDCTTTRTDPQTGAEVERPCRYPVSEGDLIRVGFGSGPVRFNHDFRGDVAVGDAVCFENGTIRTRVVDPAAVGVEPDDDALLLEVLAAGGGRMNPMMSANVPGRRLRVPCLTDRDRVALALGVDRGVGCYALSFVQEGGDLAVLDAALRALGDEGSLLVAKIEDEVGIAALADIVAAGRALGRPIAVMVARGDLFVELGPVRLFAAQEQLVVLCRQLGVPSIVATGLLRSMTDAAGPSRAEVCDVAAALRQGADSLMLSDETSNGRYPAQAVRMLAALVAAYAGRPG